jgi:hypothetical protein
VQVTIEIVPNDPRQLHALHDWLDGDARIGLDTEIRLRTAKDEPGTQGGVFDAVNVLFNDATNFAAVTISFLAWRNSRHQDRSDVVIEHDGVKVVIPADAEWTASMIRDALGLDEDPGADQGDSDQ